MLRIRYSISPSRKPVRVAIPCEEKVEDCLFVKYNTPVRVERKSYLENEPETNDRVRADSPKVSASDIPADFCKMMISTDKPADEKTMKLLTQEFPMRVKRVGNDVYASTVRETQTSPMELAGLLNDLRMTLKQRAARARPLCHVREETLHCLARELLRQLIIDCPERGLLFKQVLEEHYKYIESYKVLMQHNDAFMCRKNLQAFHTRGTQLTKVQYLEDEIDVLKHQAKALKEAADRLEKKYQEDRRSAESQRQNELRYLRQLGEQLKGQVEVFLAGSSE
ncbi:33 kDa inner dynein arm light chain, axonemal [Echinococcus granulosus]|uniref:Dynein light chain n=1 Tax=Echinococcus granulosus TaxID=6210 RepID=A0A068WS09_ECHGR|nr:33 kDa inner dynein arm light chain, axonemal [Echinococcus granulosus]CDS22596.1 dynein light chain [Echinococcus granulosus]